MRWIKKGKEPKRWQEHRLSPGATYDPAKGHGPSKEAKDDLRAALVTEQGHLCAYCMSRIAASEDAMKVEHFIPQSTATAELDYKNLLGVCLGGVGSPPKQQHCDTFRGAKPLKIHPAGPRDCSSKFSYRDDGEIRGKDADAIEAIDNLNLNVATLKNARKAVLEALLTWTNSGKNRARTLSREELEAKAVEWAQIADGKLAAFCEVAIWWLRRHASTR